MKLPIHRFCASIFLSFFFFFSQGLYASQTIIPAPPKLAAKSYLLIDANSGKILVEHNADNRLPPASLTKMMTSYITANELSVGSINIDDSVQVSVKAWRMGGSRMFIKEGTTVELSDLMKGIVIQSGNDASVATAEHIAGTEELFAELMNKHAINLGMKDTHFANATGMPHPDHYTTARDLATLARAVINDFPEHYSLYKEKSFIYNNISQTNRNLLLFWDDHVDGLKTGHTEEAGYCLVSSSVQNNMRLISVVLGANSEKSRARESQKLLTYGFRFYQTLKLYSQGDELTKTEVWGGESNLAQLTVGDDVYITIPRGADDQLRAIPAINSPIIAPITTGQVLGEIMINLEDEMITKTPLLAIQGIEEGHFFKRLWDKFRLFFHEIFSKIN